jgi:hypothetical protein
MSLHIDNFEDVVNPLDSVEEILTANNWVFNRMNNDELMVRVTGKNCDYRLFFIWQEDMSAMQFCCQYDFSVSGANQENAARALMTINEALWMGHFDIPKDTSVPSFRHTCLLRGVMGTAGIEHLEDMVDVAMAQCERYYYAFDMLSQPQITDDQRLSLALMETTGHA